MDEPVFVDRFFTDGRGPELQRIHWGPKGAHIQAIDYFNPTDKHQPAFLKHVSFLRAQVVMVTPEEVIDYERLGSLLSKHRPAAMFDLGKSDWLLSFAQRHLDNCHHYQLLFYDQLLDVIADGVECVGGGYSG